MKHLLILLAFALSGCTCVMSQSVPPQIIYVDANCQGVIPDYTGMFTYTDNCRIDTVFQYPEAGYILTSEENSVNMQIIAVDEFLNASTVIFPVTVVDTISPQILYNSSIVSFKLKSKTQK